MTLSPTPQSGHEPRSFEERLQARLEAIEANPTAVPQPWPTRTSRPDRSDADSSTDQANDDPLARQIQQLRDHLDQALEDVDQRLEEAAARILRAELRATFADARTGDVLEALAKLERSLRTNPPATLEESTVRFRGVVDQLRERLNTSS